MYLHPHPTSTNFISISSQITFILLKNVNKKHLVDKRNANDVIVKLMDLGVSPLNGTVKEAINKKDLTSSPLSITTGNYNNCDGNQNDDADEKGKFICNL